MEVVGGSIPLATTNPLTRCPVLALRPYSSGSRTLPVTLLESRMLSFPGSTVDVTLLLKIIL